MFTEKIRYILKLLLHLAVEDNRDFETVGTLADELDIPSAYLGKLVAELSDLGYLETRKGPRGGVRLRDPADEVFVTPLLNDMGVLEHNPHGDACCVPSYFDNCIVSHWISSFKQHTLGKSTLLDLTEVLHPSAGTR